MIYDDPRHYYEAGAINADLRKSGYASLPWSIVEEEVRARAKFCGYTREHEDQLVEYVREGLYVVGGA